eukprot:SAG31_NODE_153_length_22196_cov_24.963570_19_plen_97_part_00
MRPAVNAEIAAGTLKQGTDAAAVTKVLGERWSALDAEAKKKYEDLANKDKERYAAECKEVRLPPSRSLKTIELLRAIASTSAGFMRSAVNVLAGGN